MSEHSFPLSEGDHRTSALLKAQVRADFVGLLQAHHEYISLESQRYIKRLRWELALFYFAFFFCAFAFIQLLEWSLLYFEGLGTEGPSQHDLYTGITLLAVAIILFVLRHVLHAKTQTMGSRIFKEAQKDWQWIKDLI